MIYVRSLALFLMDLLCYNAYFCNNTKEKKKKNQHERVVIFDLIAIGHTPYFFSLKFYFYKKETSCVSMLFLMLWNLFTMFLVII